MFDKRQFKEMIEDVLKRLDLYSESAVNLLLGTAAQESRFGTYLKQLGTGPAMGVFQMEPATELDIWKNFLAYKAPLVQKLREVCGNDKPNPQALKGNLYYAIAMCRIHYLRKTEPLPAADDIRGLGLYWKRHYNTMLGKGTIDEFVENYKKYVGA